MKERTKKISVLFIALFIISIMIASVLNFGLYSNETPQQAALTYNGYDFYQTNIGGWLTEKDGKQIALTYNPQQIDNVSLGDVDLTTLKFSEKVYLTHDANKINLEIAANDLIRNIALPKIVRACPEDGSGCENFPLKTCEDSTDSTGVIYLKEAETEIIQLEKNCLFIQAQSSDIIKIVDRIIYKELGII